VLAKSKPVPIKHIIASANVSSEVQAAVRDYLLGLDGSEDGKRQLEPTKYSGFDRFDQAELLKLGDWLGL
jgi:ABC-type phosphate/phosphonate transport system substrate-binding protein